MSDFSPRLEMSFGSLNDSIQAALAGAHVNFPDYDGLEPRMMPTSGSIDLSYTIGAAPRLTLENFAGDARIVGGDDSVIRVQADGIYLDKHGLPGNIRQDGDHIMISQVLIHGPEPVSYRISVPRGCSVTTSGVEADVRLIDTEGTAQVETISGDVSLAGIAGDCRINAVEGDIHLERIAGACVLSMVSGDVTGRRIEGSLEVHAVDGEIRINDSRLPQCTATTHSGDVFIETAVSPDGVYHLRSTDGDVRISVPLVSAATISLSSQHGDISAGAGTELSRRDRHHWEGTLSGGGATIRLQSLHGDVALDTTASRFHADEVIPAIEPLPPIEPVPALEPIPALEPRSTHEPEREHTIDVLGRLERGELTVEEAMAHLNDL